MVLVAWATAFIVGCLVGLSCAGEAAASPWDTKAQAIATHRYGDVCAGKVTLTSAPLPGNAAAQSRWLQWPDGTKTDCYVIFDTIAVAKMRWPQFCTFLVHEYGHLGEWGIRHSLNPKSLMFWAPTATYRLCRGAFKP